MNKTKKPTQGWAKFGIYGKASEKEQKYLNLANDYKDRLLNIKQNFYRRRIDLRNEYWPEIFEYLTAKSVISAKIYECEQAIKAKNIEQRTRNSITEKRNELLELKKQYKQHQDKNKNIFEPYWASINYVNQIKSDKAKKNKKWYLRGNSDLKYNFEIDYYELLCEERDSEKQLSIEFQKLGLLSDIRSEVAEATKKAKVSYYKITNESSVRKLTIQIKGGGLSFKSLLDGKSSVLNINCLKNNLYKIKQRVGAGPKYEFIEYILKIHRAIPNDCIIQRWSVCFDDMGKRYVSPTISRQSGFQKPIGKGTVAYDLNWREDKDELIVAYILSEKMEEQITLPRWLCNNFRYCFELDAEIDLLCKLQLGVSGQKSGNNNYQRLETYILNNPDDQESIAVFHSASRKKLKRKKLYRRATRARNNIYLYAVDKIRRNHSEIIIDKIKISDLSRNKNKNILDTKDKLARKTRQNRTIVSPGYLNELLEKSGLMVRKDINCAFSSCVCPKCHYNNGNQTEDNSNKVKTCSKCGNKFDRDFAACIETLIRAKAPFKSGKTRQDDIIKTYVEKLGKKQTKQLDEKLKNLSFQSVN